MSSEFMLNQSLASDSHGISDKKWGSLKADLPYCQTMTFKILSHALFQFYLCQIRLWGWLMSRPFPAYLLAKRYVQETPKQNFGLSLNWLNITSVKSTALGDKWCHTGRTLYPAHAVQHSITPLPPASGAKRTQASYTPQRHRSIQVFLVVARK